MKMINHADRWCYSLTVIEPPTGTPRAFARLLGSFPGGRKEVEQWTLC
jgi:hypothetical protein